MKKLFSLMIAAFGLGIAVTGCSDNDEPTPAPTPDPIPHEIPAPVSKETFDKEAVGKLWVFDEMHLVGYDGSQIKYEEPFMLVGPSVESEAYYFGADGFCSEYTTVMFGKDYFGVDSELDRYCIVYPFEYGKDYIENTEITAVTKDCLVMTSLKGWQKDFAEMYPEASEEELENSYLQMTYKPQTMEESASWRSTYVAVHRK